MENKITAAAQATLAAYAKVYNLKLNCRASDHLRRIDVDATAKSRHAQSVLEHAALTAKLLEFVYLNYSERLHRAGENLDVVWASFMASHHDDPEWLTGDMVPVLGYRSFDEKDKHFKEHTAMQNLLGDAPNFLRESYEEYERRSTAAARLVKVCDILELFAHNRILLAFGYGVITWQNYLDFAPETREESLLFLRKSSAGVTSIAEILEYSYKGRFDAMDFPPVYREIFYELADAITDFPFYSYVVSKT